MLTEIIGLERLGFLHLRNTELQSFYKEPERWTDEQAKASFDAFYEEVNNWRDEFNTTALADFWAIGVGYDGCTPGINKPFLGLYHELMVIATTAATYKEE